MEEIKEILDFELIPLEGVHFTVANLLMGVLVLVIARLLYGLIVRIMRRVLMKSGKYDQGRFFSLRTILRYLFVLIAVLLVLTTSGIDITVLVAASTALFVGLGFGLQNIANDFVSGIILLFEGTLKVNDIVVVEGTVARVVSIKIRYSELITRDGTTFVVPNSILTGNSILNLTNPEELTRFKVSVGVAYGSDTRKVENLLLQVAGQHEQVCEDPPPKVFFSNFGDSSLDFELYFWTRNTFQVPLTESDIRFSIDELFRKEDIEIPFPQRDIHIKTQKGVTPTAAGL